MKKYILLAVVLLTSVVVFTQPVKKPAQKKPAQSEMDKAMEEAMKDMSPEEKAEMKKMMGNLMPDLMEQNSKIADYPAFTSNKQLIPKKDIARINALPKKLLQQADMSNYATTLFNKIMTKGEAAEIALIKKIITQSPKANQLGNAAILCMMQGHPQAAMALSMKAVQADPANVNWQNNMASLLTQYGYPEQAIPVLQKLKNQFPRNSTALNNLAYAWLGLGETDSAKFYAGSAIRANPYHPDALLCGGLMEELKGDPIKATDDYIKSMENAINPFTEALLKNNNGQGRLEQLDFNKIKRSITIYEYFPKGWMPAIPLLSCSTNGYAKDEAIQSGYDLMANRLKEKIETMTTELSRDLENLADKGEEEFVKTMASENIKGLNFMSKPATLVLLILLNYQKSWMGKYTEEALKVNNLKASHYLEFKKTTENLKGDHKQTCKIYDAAANKYMQAVNPMLKKFYTEKAEEFRQWVNAYITWNWYVTGNPKNVIMIQDLGFVAMLEAMYRSAIEIQVAINGSCNTQRETAPLNIAEPVIPNFSCPAVVSIPVGADWQQLTQTAKNFDNNTSGVKQSAKNPVPNSSIAYGIGHGTIAQPGRAPFVKTANGSLSPGMINSEALTPLSNIPADELTPLPDLRKSNFAKMLLKKTMSADCKNVNKYKYKPPKFEVGIGELELLEPDSLVVTIGKIVLLDPPKQITSSVKDGDVTYVEYDDGSAAAFFEDGRVFELGAPINPEKTGVNSSSIKPKAPKEDMTSKNKVYGELKDAKKHYDANGLQPSISSGLQVPGIFTTIKGLFN